MQCETHRYDSAMAIYTVYTPPDGDAGKARFVRDGVNVVALVIPAIWLLWQRLWLWLLVYILLALAIGLASRLIGAGATLLAILPGFYLLLEGNELVRARLERHGWQLADVVEAPNQADAELRFFAARPERERSLSSAASEAAPQKM